MPDGVKPARRYDASRRRAQANTTRRRVLEEARRLFLDYGYAKAAMPQIASAAGVSVQTVYKAFANKAALLKAVSDVAVAGDDDDVPMAERDIIGNIRAEPDAAGKITLYLSHLAQGSSRYAPVQLLARAAASADPAACAVWEQIRADTLSAMTMFAADLVSTGQLHHGLSADDVRDVLWVYHSPEIFEMLVLARGWDTHRYGRFLTEAVIDALLLTTAPPPAEGRP
jgi:AcrR family transcriptional regulator